MRSKQALLVACLALGAGGCVTTGTYNEMKAKADELQHKLTQMEMAKEGLEHQNEGLEKDLGAEKQSVESLSKTKSTLEQEKSELQQVKDSLEKATAELSAQNAQLAAEKAALLKESEDKKAQYEGVLGQLKQEVANGQLKITQFKNMLTLDVADKILFDSGKADLKPEGKAVLLKVGQALAKGEKIVRVEGHTDNVPLSAGAIYTSNWELSAARATTVVRFLQDKGGIEPRRLVASGRGEWSPAAANDSPANKQKNRRIEITLLDKALVEGVEEKK